MIYIKYAFQWDDKTMWSESDDFEQALAQAFETLKIDLIRVPAAQGQENVPIFVMAKKAEPDLPQENEPPAAETTPEDAKVKPGKAVVLPKGILKRIQIFKVPQQIRKIKILRGMNG